MYKAIFFDVDDTLLDFTLCSRSALEKVFKKFALPFADKEFACFQEIDSMLWAKQKQGILTIEQVLDRRFRLIAEALNLTVSGDDLSAEFIDRLKYTDILTPYAKETLSFLHDSGKYKLYVTSNGILDMQLNRLELSGLIDFFDGIYVSDDIGYEKPDKRFFQESLFRSGFAPSEVLMIGDSMEADIKGATGAEIDAVWYNPKGKASETMPKYVIKSLAELKEIL